MKKNLLLTLALALGLMVGCGGNETTEAEKTEAASQSQTQATEKQEEKTEETTKEIIEESSETSSEETKEAETVSGTFTADFDLSNHAANESVRLWVPHAQSDEYQEISNIKISTAEGEEVPFEVNTDDKGNEMIYVEWTPEQTDRKLSYSFDVTRTERLKPEFKPEEEINRDEFKDYLSESTLVPIGGEVAELSKEILKDGASVEDKSRAIYDWIFVNMERNNDVLGCGPGDVLASLKSLDGKCTDINSVYVALARSAGLPAKETFGVRLSKKPEEDVTKFQHCWAEYYQPGTGWVVTDVADVLKAVLNDELAKDSPEAKELYDYYYGNVDAVRVAFSTGRDLILVPEQANVPLNQFGYPYAEVDGEALDFYYPDEFGYKLTFVNKD